MQCSQQNDIEWQPNTSEQAELGANADEVVALLKSGGGQHRIILSITGALVVGFGLGWGCAGYFAGPIQIAQTEMLSRRSTATGSGTTNEGPRKTASTTAQKPLSVSAAMPVPKVQSTSLGAMRPVVNTSSVPPATQVNMTLAAREPLVAAPETKPTTIEGWTVLDVRGGTIVLAGPEGVRTAATGDIVPGIGRIDSVVRWGNRWIVATASGLIATP